jgi:hypothetical protein
MRRKLHKYKRKAKARQRSILKPIAPESYDGTADQRKFHKFVVQAMRYVKDGHVPRKDRVMRFMNFLTDKAYEFFLSRVSYEADNWTLTTFFQELFNYCFPIDYRSLLRKKFRQCRQDDRRVREFVAELQEF